MLKTLPLFVRRLKHLRICVRLAASASYAERLAVHTLVRALRLVRLIVSIDGAVVAATHGLHLACGNRPHSYPGHL